MIRTCELCPTPIPPSEPDWKKLCRACYAKTKRDPAAPPRKTYAPAPAPNLFSPLRTAIEEKAPHRPAPFGSLRELMDFLFSSENRAACAETSVMRLEKENAALKLEIEQLKGADSDFF